MLTNRTLKRITLLQWQHVKQERNNVFIVPCKFTSNTLYILYVQWHMNICFEPTCPFPSTQNSSQKILNTETVIKMKIKYAVICYLCFVPIQNHNSKRKMFRHLWIKPEEKVWLKLCGFEARAATDRVLSSLLRRKTKQKLLRHYTVKNGVLIFYHML